MIYVLTHRVVANFATWKQVFDADMPRCVTMGAGDPKIFRDIENPHKVTVFCEWRDLDSAKQFYSSVESLAKRQDAGVQGELEIHYITEV